ncbi:MAG: hypothetical protein RIE08_16495 [Acidimicrobiales bacterium]
MVATLRSLPLRTWPRAVPIALIAYVLIAVPSDLIDTPWFGRPVPIRAIDYVIASIAAALIGLTLAIRPESSVVDGVAGSGGDTARADAVGALEGEDTRTVWGGFASFLAVGCPVCNQAVVALIGTGGALSWWAPVQPVVGLIAIGLLVHTLRRRLATYDLVACPLPGARPVA